MVDSGEALKLAGIRYRQPGFTLTLTLALAPGETLALLGPSGSGKTTVLKIAAGLLSPEAGRVQIGGRDVTALPPERRGVGMLFQSYALFPHLSVFDNVAFGLVERGWSRKAILARVEELLAITGLTPHRQKRPNELSGGEQQRVALARALAPRPPVLLLDEPLGALDLRLRESLLLELKRVLRAEGVAALYVTHDQAEAFVLAHRVLILRDGRKVQEGTPEEVFQHPSDAWTARFLGHKNVLGPEDAAKLGLPRGTHLLPNAALRPGRGEPARVEEVLFLGPRLGLWLFQRGVRLYWEGPLEPIPKPGTELPLAIDLQRAVPL